MSEMTNPKISLKELCRLWGMEESPELSNLYHEINSTYVEVSEGENTRLVSYVNKILNGELVLAGESRADDWERGWQENFELFRKSGNLEDLKPRYFGKTLQIRWMSKWIVPNDSDLIGLDWAKSSQKLVQEISSKLNDELLTAQNFDYFNPHLLAKE